MDGDQVIEGEDNLLNHATAYYKELFGPTEGNAFPLDPNLWNEGERASDEDNDFLRGLFSEAEIKKAMFMMEKNKVAGPNNIPIEFYQSCWLIIKNDILEFFGEFHSGVLDVSRVNYGIITLLPKISNANKIQQFRPICLLNCLYKWITKVLSLRLEVVAEKLILNTQSAFMKGTYIMNSVLALHEVLHEIKKRKMK